MSYAAHLACPLEKKEKITFSFGRNWQEYLDRCLTPEREAIAVRSLKEFFELESMEGLSFVDVGCGSGLFSLSAHRLGARSIVSIDVDPFSVRCCERLRERAGNPPDWQVLHGSALDAEFMARLEPADIVYAWGSLHHTGNMWQAIGNVAACVKPGGLFVISIYNHATGRESSESWLRIKRFYNRSSRAVKFLMESAFYTRYGVLPSLVRFQNPVRFIRNYPKFRGMTLWVDTKDWLGGYPYEFARPEQILRFCRREFGMELINLRTTQTTGVNEFLFRKRGVK